ncbi:MAG: sigma-70 family RNA polymerase sigma factor [Chloroflexi bacterium]|nr:sigma-70 family RNA polymerase sigma factor [Chloroflexota bacterium]
MDDAEAVQRLKHRDIGGLETLVTRYQVQALRAAYLVTRDRFLAEDVVQEAFLRLVQRVRSFDDGRPFAPWFLRIVINDAIKAVDHAGVAAVANANQLWYTCWAWRVLSLRSATWSGGNRPPKREQA